MDNLLGIWKVFGSGEATGIIQLLAFDLSVGREPITTCMRSRSVFWNQKAARESRHISRACLMPDVHVVWHATLGKMWKNTKAGKRAARTRGNVKSNMVGWEYRGDCMDPQAMSSAMLRVGRGSARTCSGRRCLHEGSKTRQQVRQKERQRTYGSPYIRKRTSTRRSNTQYDIPLLYMGDVAQRHVVRTGET